jgi:hypothetical protein
MPISSAASAGTNAHAPRRIAPTRAVYEERDDGYAQHEQTHPATSAQRGPLHTAIVARAKRARMCRKSQARG